MSITLEHIEAEQAKVSELIAKFKANQSRQFHLPAITLELASGEECAGLVLTSEGKPSHYLILNQQPGARIVVWLLFGGLRPHDNPKFSPGQ